MKKLKKLFASVLVTLALTATAFGGVIECPLTPPQQSPSTTIQGGPAVEAGSAGAGSAESDDAYSLTKAALTLLESVALALF